MSAQGVHKESAEYKPSEQEIEMKTLVTIRMTLAKTIEVTHSEEVDPEIVVDSLFKSDKIRLNMKDDTMFEETSITEDERDKGMTIPTMSVEVRTSTTVL